VPDLPLCLCVLKHRAPLTRGGIFLPKFKFEGVLFRNDSRLSAEVNKKHFKELTKYKNTVIDTTFPRFINLFSSKANLLGRAPYLISEIGRPGRLSTLSLCLESSLIVYALMGQ
jgi:hypothetical protein